MLEIFVFGMITFLFAYLFVNPPASEGGLTRQAFRLLFFGLTIWTLYLTVLLTLSPSPTTAEYNYYPNGTLESYTFTNETQPSEVKTSVLGYVGILNNVNLFIFFIMGIMLLVSVLDFLLTKKGHEQI